MGAFIDTDLRQQYREGLTLPWKSDLGASLRGGAVCRIVSIRYALGPNTEGRNGLAGGRVRVKFSFKIFSRLSAKFKISASLILFSGMHVSSISDWLFHVEINGNPVRYASALLQCDCHGPEHRYIAFAGLSGNAIVLARDN